MVLVVWVILVKHRGGNFAYFVSDLLEILLKKSWNAFSILIILLCPIFLQYAPLVLISSLLIDAFSSNCAGYGIQGSGCFPPKKGFWLVLYFFSDEMLVVLVIHLSFLHNTWIGKESQCKSYHLMQYIRSISVLLLFAAATVYEKMAALLIFFRSSWAAAALTMFKII